MLLNSFIMWTCFALLLCIGYSLGGPTCKNRVDIVIAVDTTSSLTLSDFENVKAEVKAIVTGFTIGQAHTRLALISITDQATVIANFDNVNSLADFNAAVDKLIFSSGKARLSEGIKVAKNSVMNNARTTQVTKALVLVKDQRSERISDSAELSHIASEAGGIKSIKVSIHAVGVGGLWSILELHALFGTEYLMFKNKNALNSAKSLNNLVCEADCPQNGASQTIEGLCYAFTKHVITTTIALTTDSTGVSVCRTEGSRTFMPCSVKQSCNNVDRRVSSCGTDGKVTVTSSWQSFDLKQQSCITLDAKSVVDCADAWKCQDQVADVVFIMDQSGSLWRFRSAPDSRNHFNDVKAATGALAKALNIGPNNVRVGVIKYGNSVVTIVPFGSINDRNAVLKEIESTPIMGRYDFNTTSTDLAFAEAGRIFKAHGRKDVAKYVMLLTDGESDNASSTLIESERLKNEGVTIIAVGIALKKDSELKAITAPETSTNMVVLHEFDKLKVWTDEFSKKMCLRMTAPNPKLCVDKVFFQQVADCMGDKQTVTRTEFKYSDANKCIKTIQITEHTTCTYVCHNPIDGNMYRKGDTWTSLCHEFECTNGAKSPFVPVRSNCLAADGTCKGIGSPPFRCINGMTKMETDNCRCIEKDGKPILVIDV